MNNIGQGLGDWQQAQMYGLGGLQQSYRVPEETDPIVLAKKRLLIVQSNLKQVEAWTKEEARLLRIIASVEDQPNA